MKKRKFALILNLASICLSICAIVIGVYSIKTAALNVGGKIGFTAHNVNLNIQAYMYGYSSEAAGTNITTEESKTQLTKDGGLSVNGDTGTINLGATKGSGTETRYFSDINGAVEPIKVVLVLKNIADFEVLVEDTTATSTSYSVVCDDGFTVIYTDDTDNTKTITYSILPAKDSNGKYVEMTTPVDVSLSMNFSQLNTNISSTDGYLFEDTSKPNKLTAVPAKTDSDLLVIPSTFTDGKTATSIIGGAAVPIKNSSSYSKIIVLKGITSLESAAFMSCKNLTSIYIPDTVTSIADYMFWYCSNLTSITIPASVTTFENTNIYNIFNENTNLKTLNYKGTLAQFKSLLSTSTLTNNLCDIYCSDGVIAKGESFK